MFSRIIKIVAISSMFFLSAAFAEGRGHHHHYGYGYSPYYGGYAPPVMRYYPIQQPYYAPPPVAAYGGYGYGNAPIIVVPFFGGGWGHGGFGHHGHH